ncbi:MAG: flavin reductase family protein [Geminicoccaceae bacterium]
MTVTTDDFIAGMRLYPGAVTAITTLCNGVRAGLTATSVCSLSAEPPQMLACVNRAAEAHDLIVRARLFAINLLTKSQATLADRFAGADDCSGEARFEGATWLAAVTGAPLLRDALVAFDCRLVALYDGATHSILVGRVEAVHHGADGAAPLVYRASTYRTLAD